MNAMMEILRWDMGVMKFVNVKVVNGIFAVEWVGNRRGAVEDCVVGWNNVDCIQS